MYRRNTENLIKNKKTKKVKHSKEGVISESELQQLLASVKEENYFDKVIIILAGYHGMREGEIAHMEKTWIDFNKEVIRIPAEKKCNCYECVQRKKKLALEEGMKPEQVAKITTGVWIPKTPKAVRAIPLRYDREIVKVTIEKYFSYYRKIGCSRQTIYQHIMGIVRTSGIPKKIHPHSLRATCASIWGQMGITPVTLCNFMGWENIETANVYVTTDEESAQREAKWLMSKSRGY